MTLRLVLVGMVAALGVSIPSQPSSEHWFESAEAWATSLLAEWDTWEPTNGDGTGPAGKGDQLACEECRLARLRVASNAMRAAAGDPPAPNREASAPATTITALSGDSMPASASQHVFVGWVQPTVPATAPATQTKPSTPVAFEPICVSEPYETGIAYELNRISEGLGDSETLPSILATTTDSELALAAEDFELDMLDELYRIASEPAEVAKPSIVERSGDEPITCLDEEWARAGCLDEPQAASDELTVFADLPRNVFAPASLPAVDPDLGKPAVIPAIGSLAYLARTAAVASPVTVPKPFTGLVPAIGTLVYLSRHDASVPSPASSKLTAFHAPESATFIAWFKKGSGTVVLSTHRAVPATVPDPFLNQATLVDLPRDVFAPASSVLAQGSLHPDQALVGRDSQPAGLGDAVELTRRAVSAWVSVLIGPALVDVSRR
jgi:hypothetical protein